VDSGGSSIKANNGEEEWRSSNIRFKLVFRTYYSIIL